MTTPTRRPGAGEGRRELLAAAAQEFAELGYAGATTAGIARRAGVTQPLVHHHFGSKEGLWLAVVDELFGELQAALDSAAATMTTTPPSRQERLRALLGTLIRFSGTRPLLSRLIRAEGQRNSEAFDLVYQRWLVKLLAFFADEVGGAVSDGTLRQLSPGLLYFVIVGASVEAFAQPEMAQRAFGLDMTSTPVIEDYTHTVIDVLLHGILAR